MKTRLLLFFLLLSVLASAQTYTYSTLYSFTSGTKHPKFPLSLIIDSSGNLYGTALGGPHGYGTVFKVTSKGVETTLWDFTYSEVGGNEGGIPGPNIARDKNGNLYGELNYGSDKQDWGTVFELVNSKGTYSFSGIAGGPPTGEVTYADSAVFWIACEDDQGPPCFSASLMETVNGQTTTLWNFSDPSNTSDPPAGSLVVNGAGNIYGTVPGDYGQTSYGYVYEWSPTAGFSVLHTFDGVDGSLPNVLRQDAAGNLYGATAGDGTDNDGTVFKITSAGAFSVLYTFPTGDDGPTGSLTLDSSDNIYGTTGGSVFKITAGGVESVIYNGGSGAGLVMDKSGNLYGTNGQGANGLGSVYKLTKK